jgi:hypothetical protein
LKKGIVAIAALFGVLAITSGAFAAQHYLITSSSQIKDGTVRLADLAPGARKALHGHNGAKGDRGPAGPKGDAGSQGPQGPAGKAAPTLQRLAGDFSGTNASVATSLDGVQFGPYAATSNGIVGGSVRYTGAKGRTLGDITQLSYTIMHSSSDDSPIAAPYLRIFLNNGHDVVFDATKCASFVPDENVFNTYEVTTGDVRYDDDPCSSGSSQQSWATVKAAHANEVITGIYVTSGFSGGSDLTALLRGLSVNGHQFTFGSA